MPPAIKRRTQGRIPLPKTDLVPCFHAGSDRTRTPDFTKERADLHAWKEEGRGYFADHGTTFQMLSAVMSVERGISSNAAAIPFSPVQNKMRKPHPLNYPIPAVMDHRLRWLSRFMIPEQTKAECY